MKTGVTKDDVIYTGNRLEQPEVKLWLDSYDDLFSDFDPRPYSKRTLSDDFISQAKKVTREQSGQHFILQLLLPASLRERKQEEIIAQRLPLFFKRIYSQLKDERRRTKKKGFKLVAAGIVFMVLGGYISFSNPEGFHIHLLLIVFEPAGWFLFWSGLDLLLEFSEKTKPDLRFYSEMAQTKIIFGSY